MEQYKVLVRNMEQIYPGLDTESLPLVLVCKHSKTGWTLILSGKSPCKREMDLWTQMAFTIYRREKKKYSVKKTISHVFIAVVGDPLSLCCWGAEIPTSSTSGPTHGEPIWNWGAVGASSSFVFPGRIPEKLNKWGQFAFKHQSWSDEMHKFSHAWP